MRSHLLLASLLLQGALCLAQDATRLEQVFYLEGTNLRVEFVRDASGSIVELVMHQGTRQDRAKRVE